MVDAATPRKPETPLGFMPLEARKPSPTPDVARSPDPSDEGHPGHAEASRTTAPSAPFHGHGYGQVLAVGFGGHFPPFLKRILADEFPFVEADGHGDPQPRDAAAGSNVILIHESVLRQSGPSDPRLADHSCGDVPALVYAAEPPDRETVQRCLSLGVKSFLSFNMQVELIVRAISMMLDGGRYIAPEIVDRHFANRPIGDGAPLTPHAAEGSRAANAPKQRASVAAASIVTPDPQPLPGGLTARENEVLALVAEGMQNKTIAHALDLSENTVKLHVHHLIAKIGVHNRTELAVVYHAHRAQSANGTDRVGEEATAP